MTIVFQIIEQPDLLPFLQITLHVSWVKSSITHSRRDISASGVKEVEIQKRARRAGWGGSQERKEEKKRTHTKSPGRNLPSTELKGREDGNMLNTNLKMTLDWLKVCEVNTRGVLSSS